MKCAIYTRVSTDNQVEGNFNSCESQKEKIKSFIKSQDKMVVYGVFSDPGFTGANLERPALQKMLQAIKERQIDMVIVYKMDRLTRSPKDFYHLIELFEKCNVGFISVTERFDTSTPSGRLLRNIMLTFAQFERELASERVKDKMHQRAQKGMWNGGTVPFGYEKENKKLIINEDEANMLKKIYGLYIETGSLGRILNARFKGRNGKPLSKNTLYYMLRNINYTGKMRYGGKVTEGIHPAIISEAVFTRAQELHGSKDKPTTFNKKYLFSGLLKCSECGSHMTPCHTKKQNKNRKNKTRYYYYRCTKTFRNSWDSCSIKQVNAKRLEDHIITSLERISIDKPYIDSLIYMLNSNNVGDHSGLEPQEKLLHFVPEIFKNTLQTFFKDFTKSKGIEKVLLIKKHVKNITYSKEEITLSLYYKKTCEEEETQSPASGRAGAAAGRSDENRQKNSPLTRLGGNEVVSRLGLEPSTHALKGRCSTG